MPQEKICCFTGHRTVAEKDVARLRPLLALILKDLYDDGYRIFRNGGAIGFDTIAAIEVARLKQEHHDIKLNFFLPCRDQCNKWLARDIKPYKEVLGAADEVSYVSTFYTPMCMQTRNMNLVNDADLCICYRRPGTGGGTAFTVNYAKKNEVDIINLLDILED